MGYFSILRLPLSSSGAHDIPCWSVPRVMGLVAINNVPSMAVFVSRVPSTADRKNLGVVPLSSLEMGYRAKMILEMFGSIHVLEESVEMIYVSREP